MSGELADDVTWTRLLQRAIQNAERTTLQAAIRSLPDVDVQFLLQLVEDKRHNLEIQLRNDPECTDYPVDHALAIWVYTLEAVSVYKVINGYAHASDRSNGPGGVSAGFAACLPCIKYLDRALTLLPAKFHYAGQCQRGVQYVFPSSQDHDPVKHFPTGKHLFFYEFKSASTERSVMSSD